MSSATHTGAFVSGVAADLETHYQNIRERSLDLCAPLEIEDYCVQPMTDASPPKWHLAHTTWFFERFVLTPYRRGYRPFHPRYEYLFNSYYNAVGAQYARPRRGSLSRPTVREVGDYRRSVDDRVLALLGHLGEHEDSTAIRQRMVLGLHHEEQHQELMFTDLKYNFGHNPLHPTYRSEVSAGGLAAAPLDWVAFPGGEVSLGAEPRTGDRYETFVFDNETPRHERLVLPFALATRPVSNGEYLEFIRDGGYGRHELWLSDGWSLLKNTAWQAPLYWQVRDREATYYTLAGERELDLDQPVCHVSFYEADAYARWAGRRLPSEVEWEVAAHDAPPAGNLLDTGALQPRGALAGQGGLQQLFGDVWEWTASSYAPYPRFRPLPGALGEYNGKFMANQMVLRGGSCVTPGAHIRATYRNFFYPPDRWQFSGIRLAEDR